jgi:hypothetical protein
MDSNAPRPTRGSHGLDPAWPLRTLERFKLGFDT